MNERARYLDGIVTRAVALDHRALATAFIRGVDACSRSLGGAAGFLHAALDIVRVVGAVAGHIEPRKHTITGLLTSASAILLRVLAGSPVRMKCSFAVLECCKRRQRLVRRLRWPRTSLPMTGWSRCWKNALLRSMWSAEDYSSEGYEGFV